MILQIFLAPEAVIVHPERANGPILRIHATQQASLDYTSSLQKSLHVRFFPTWAGFSQDSSHLGVISCLILSDIVYACHSPPLTHSPPDPALSRTAYFNCGLIKPHSDAFSSLFWSKPFTKPLPQLPGVCPFWAHPLINASFLWWAPPAPPCFLHLFNLFAVHFEPFSGRHDITPSISI